MLRLQRSIGFAKAVNRKLNFYYLVKNRMSEGGYKIHLATVHFTTFAVVLRPPGYFSFVCWKFRRR